MAIKPIEILINAKDNASGVFNSLKGTVATVGAAIATYFGINAFANIVKGAADLEQGMSRVQAATGATAEEMAALRKAAEDAGANTKYTATEAACIGAMPISGFNNCLSWPANWPRWTCTCRGANDRRHP